MWKLACSFISIKPSDNENNVDGPVTTGPCCFLCSRKCHRGLRERVGREDGRRSARDAQSSDGQPEPALGNHRPRRLHGNRAEHSESTDTYSGETRWTEDWKCEVQPFPNREALMETASLRTGSHHSRWLGVFVSSCREQQMGGVYIICIIQTASGTKSVTQ